jgi:hypothetical protein
MSEAKETCQAILKTGKRKGEFCGMEKCKTHERDRSKIDNTKWRLFKNTIRN